VTGVIKVWDSEKNRKNITEMLCKLFSGSLRGSRGLSILFLVWVKLHSQPIIVF
jgi:hypothetical protein